mmetsp:Transcript_29849/g.76667  ORF Transcript_29849/g.76667 Transcript_29849/m.76667 type:complete len:290 (-) Transcript_29849:103-972(-)
MIFKCRPHPKPRDRCLMTPLWWRRSQPKSTLRFSRRKKEEYLAQVVDDKTRTEIRNCISRLYNIYGDRLADPESITATGRLKRKTRGPAQDAAMPSQGEEDDALSMASLDVVPEEAPIAGAHTLEDLIELLKSTTPEQMREFRKIVKGKVAELNKEVEESLRPRVVAQLRREHFGALREQSTGPLRREHWHRKAVKKQLEERMPAIVKSASMAVLGNKNHFAVEEEREKAKDHLFLTLTKPAKATEHEGARRRNDTRMEIFATFSMSQSWKPTKLYPKNAPKVGAATRA